MSSKPIIIVAGNPRSVFFEIFFKSIKKLRIKSPIILICCKRQIEQFIKKNSIIINLNYIEKEEILKNIQLKKINLLNVNLKNSKNLNLMKKNTKLYLSKCFGHAFDLINNKISNKLINGPINKKSFLNGKYPGITEYISKKFNIKETGMLIFNKTLSVSPLTTHVPLKNVAKKINLKLVINKIKLLDKFFKNVLKIKPTMAIAGINPHCESFSKYNEDEKILKIAVNYLKKNNIKIYGPFPADTLFLKANRQKYNVIIGTYHDQVLTPIKTLHEYDAINITMGLPFLRVSPDHGPNEKMIGKNKSNPLSLIRSIEFLDNR
jgi:4-hydroxy-L-threonine phosphate dehydrogenase PdxA